MRVSVIAALAAAALAAGCGDDVEPISGENAPAVTSPSGIPYERGGADGSGADGARTEADRGGIAAGGDEGSGG